MNDAKESQRSTGHGLSKLRNHFSQDMICFFFNNLVDFCNWQCLHEGGNSQGTKENKKFLPGTEIDAGDIKMNKILLSPQRREITLADHFNWCDKSWDEGMYICIIAYRAAL